MTTVTQEIKCPRCKGYGRVATVAEAPSQNDLVNYAAFLEHKFPFGEPMNVTFAEARSELRKSLQTIKQNQALIFLEDPRKSMVLGAVLKYLNDKLETCQWPESKGTGTR